MAFVKCCTPKRIAHHNLIAFKFNFFSVAFLFLHVYYIYVFFFIFFILVCCCLDAIKPVPSIYRSYYSFSYKYKYVVCTIVQKWMRPIKNKAKMREPRDHSDHMGYDGASPYSVRQIHWSLGRWSSSCRTVHIHVVDALANMLVWIAVFIVRSRGTSCAGPGGHGVHKFSLNNIFSV